MRDAALNPGQMDRDAVEHLYAQYCNAKHASSAHLPTLRDLARHCQVCVEFGCKHGASATALLLGCPGLVVSYDIAETPRARQLKELAGIGWCYRLQDTRTADDVPDCDLLFIDSLHTYAQVKAELQRHAHRVSRYLVFHDTITFGSVGAVDESGKAVPGVLGIRPAIDELMIADPSWRIARHDTHSHGLLVLARQCTADLRSWCLVQSGFTVPRFAACA